MKTIPALALTAMMAATANAHFIWLVPGESGGQPTINVCFGEDATDDSAEYLSRVKGLSVFRITGRDDAEAIVLRETDDSISAVVKPGEPSVYIATHDLGVMDRGDSRFRLLYYAKTGPDATSKVWQTAICSDDLLLDVVPMLQGDRLSVKVRFNEQPVAGAEVRASRPGGDDIDAETDARGIVTFDIVDAGLYSIRARHIEAKAGELNGRSYPETRHYSTVSVTVPASGLSPAASGLQNLPQPVTSFGAAVINDALYMYGGHTGGAHSYSMEEQSNELTKLDLKTGQWSTVLNGPHLQGLALVAHGGSLYRIGGFTAMNAAGEVHRLVSQNAVAMFEPGSSHWTDLPALPEPRSSHDAAVVGDSIYVVGGWSMNGEGESHWHDTAWKLDLTQQPLRWQPIASPPFRRRAIAVAAHAGRLFVVGGMRDKGGPTTKVAVYDPAMNEWSEGPELYVTAETETEAASSREQPRRNMSAGAMAGFGASAFATGGSLYVTTVQGILQRLSTDGSKWEVVSDGITPRFFHRLLPLNARQLIVVGGSNMSIGKFEEVEILNVEPGT
ncbi:MAG: DUF4198 domain-containing protein [Fuerstiella sp.]